MYFYYEAPKINDLKSNIYFILGHTIMRFLVKLAARHKAFVQTAVHVHLPFGDSKKFVYKAVNMTEFIQGERSMQRVIFRARGSSVDSTQFST
jgi:phage pi2 protein 07